MRQPLELAFLKRQTQIVYIIGIGILIISLLVSYVISRQVLGPVNALARGTRQMRQFNFETRVNVRSNDELGDLARDFNRMAGTLQRYETMRKNWISDISHDRWQRTGLKHESGDHLLAPGDNYGAAVIFRRA